MASKNKVTRFTAAWNGRMPASSPNGCKWYVLDLMTKEAWEPDFKKGWFRTRIAAQKAAGKLNAADLRTYSPLPNGFVAMVSDPIPRRAMALAVRP